MEVIVLRLIHVLGGTYWVGAALFNAFFLIPVLGKMGPAGGAIMGGLRQRHVFTVQPIIASLTILSGLRLMWIGSGGFTPGYFATGRGLTFASSGAAAILVFAVTIFVNRPAGQRMAAVRQAIAGSGDGEERAKLESELEMLQRRLGRSGNVMIALLVFATAGMAIGRYL